MGTPERLSSFYGRGVVLPYDARPDLAWTRTTTVQPLTPGFVTLHNVAGSDYEVLQSVTFTWNTSATVGDRYLGILIHDPSNSVVGQIIMPGSQAASTSYRYTFMLDAGSSFVSGIFGMSPLPFMLMQQGYSWQIFGSNLDGGDQQNGLVYTSQLIPTGPPRSYDQNAATIGATAPLLLT